MKNIIYINWKNSLGHRVQSHCETEDRETAYNIAQWLSKNPVIHSVDVFDVSQGHFIYSIPKLKEY